MPRFSILIPAYNALPHLGATLKSVLDQEFCDYEVVLVDDGSDDGTGGVCERFALKHADVKVVHQENVGLLLARRIALSHASGDYVVTLDSDDALRPDALGKLSRIIDECSPDFIGFPYARSLDYAAVPASRLPLVEGLYACDSYKYCEKVVCKGYLVSAWSKCCKRSVVDAGTDYSAYRGMTYAEDLLQLTPLVAAAHSFYYLDDPLYFYRFNPWSCTAHYESRYVDDLMRALKVFLQYASCLGSDCFFLAKQSALLHIDYLLHILVNSDYPSGQKVCELSEIRSCVGSAGLWGPWSAGLRVDKRLEMFALERGLFGPLCASIKMVEAVKHMRDCIRTR